MRRIKWRGRDPSAILGLVESENGEAGGLSQRQDAGWMDGAQVRQGEKQGEGHWVFGYGSLIWRPGFDAITRQKARLAGAHRRLCVSSFRHRGTSERPGLVFGLMHGGSCLGMGFEVAPDAWSATRDYLRERERDNGVYREVVRPIALEDGRQVAALAFVVDERHPQFAGKLSLDAQVEIVAGAVGESGPNPDYVRETARHLLQMGIADRAILALVAALDATEAPAARPIRPR